MGLLDDAIREHLELKRRRGADSGHVAREEREAFGGARAGEQSGQETAELDMSAVLYEEEPDQAAAWVDPVGPTADAPAGAASAQAADSQLEQLHFDQRP